MGPQHSELELPGNMAGEELCPRRRSQGDGVITHGGNNTITESMWFGKPMLVLPIFWGQHDNAQRVRETGFGARLATYSFDERQLTAAVDRLLNDQVLRNRAAAAGERLRRRPGSVVAAELIERLATTKEPLVRGDYD